MAPRSVYRACAWPRCPANSSEDPEKIKAIDNGSTAPWSRAWTSSQLASEYRAWSSPSELAAAQPTAVRVSSSAELTGASSIAATARLTTGTAAS